MSVPKVVLASLFVCITLSAQDQTRQSVDVKTSFPMCMLPPGLFSSNECVSEIQWNIIKKSFRSIKNWVPKPSHTNKKFREQMQIHSGMIVETFPEMKKYLYGKCKTVVKSIKTGIELYNFIQETIYFIGSNDHTYGSYNWFLNIIDGAISKISFKNKDKANITGIMITFYNNMFKDETYQMNDIKENIIKEKNRQCVMGKFLKIFYLLGAHEELTMVYLDMVNGKNGLPQPSMQIFNLMVKSIDIYDINEGIDILLMIHESAKIVADDYLYRELFHQMTRICDESMDNKNAAEIIVGIILNEYIARADIKPFVIKNAVAAFDELKIRFTNKQSWFIRQKICGHLR